MGLDKIQSEELQHLAADGSDQQVSVLVELDLPSQHVKMGHINRGGVTLRVPVGVDPETPEEQAATEERTAEVRKFLESLLGTSPRWLRSARSFVVRATPEQLRVIVQNPAVKAIWPNRQLQAPPSIVK